MQLHPSVIGQVSIPHIYAVRFGVHIVPRSIRVGV
jgi:hypothetical protein